MENNYILINFIKFTKFLMNHFYLNFIFYSFVFSISNATNFAFLFF